MLKNDCQKFCHLDNGCYYWLHGKAFNPGLLKELFEKVHQGSIYAFCSKHLGNKNKLGGE